MISFNFLHMKELMSVLESIEKKLDEVSAKLPQLPQNVRDLLVKLAPYFSILSVVFSGIAVLAFLAVYVAFFGFLGAWMVYGTAVGTGIIGWVQIITLIVVIICNIKAIPGLFARSRDGWLWLFYAQLAMAVSDIL